MSASWMLLRLALAAAGCQGAMGWTYTDQDNWGNDVNTPQCKAAGTQSPIDIDLSSVYAKFFPGGSDTGVIFKPGEDDSDDAVYDVDLQTNDHTWEAGFPPAFKSKAPTTTWGGKTYTLTQFHFHSPSEHTIGGDFSAMEMHMVHEAPDSQALVVAVLLHVDPDDNDEPHPYLKQIWSFFPTSIGTKVTKKLKGGPYVSMVPPLGHKDGFIHYMGSFTTPPCTTNTSWIIMLRKAAISQGQLDLYRAGINNIENNVLEAGFDPAGIKAKWNAQLSVNNRKIQSLGIRQVQFYHAGLFEQLKQAFFASAVLIVLTFVCCCGCICCCIVGCIWMCHHGKPSKKAPKTRAVDLKPKAQPVAEPQPVELPRLPQLLPAAGVSQTSFQYQQVPAAQSQYQQYQYDVPAGSQYQQSPLMSQQYP